MWNLGFTALFPKFSDNGIKFPITQTMEVELGLIAAVSLMGMAVQFQVLKLLKRKLKEIKEAQKQQDKELEERAALAISQLEREKSEWEREHPTLGKHGRKGSEFSSLLKDSDGHSLSPSPRQRYQSGVSDFIAAPVPTDEMQRSTSKLLQSPGVLPVLDLGLDIENDVPKGYIAEDTTSPKAKDTPKTQAELEELKRKEELLAEIQTIRKSIEILKTEATEPSSSSGSRHPSFTSRRTLSQDFASLLPPAASHLRPPRSADPRARVQSMELSGLSKLGASISRPTSAPLRDDDWGTYVRERKLLQPPSGVTAPIPTTPISATPRVPVSPAVEEALAKRKKLEGTVSGNGLEVAASEAVQRPSPTHHKGPSTSREIPAVLRAPQATHARSQSQGGVPVTILPPQMLLSGSQSPQPEEPPVPWTNRTLTFEELEERHREKMRELQGPVTRHEKERVDVAEAKARWERAKASEKQAVVKRQAEKAAAVSKDATKQHKSGERDSPSKPKPQTVGDRPLHPRSLSTDMLARVPGASSSKRMSTMKVEDWQKHQQDLELGLLPEEHAQRSSRRRSAVPFPETQNRPSDGRDAREHSRTPREMLS